MRAYVGLGSNLGDRAAMLRAALERLASLGKILAASSVYETEPWGKTDQPRFLNAACILETELEPRDLLHGLARIERELGRDRLAEERWGPRVIDLDLLLYDGRVENTDALAVPHPRLHERAFALVPLAEIAPEAVHPLLGKRISDLAKQLGRAGVRRVGPPAPFGPPDSARRR